MKIELKNIKVSEHLSEETNAFTANIYINGTHAGIASNHGTGGPTNYQPVSERGKQLIREAEDYCSKLPQEHFTHAGEEYSIEMNLEHFIDNLLEKNLQEKELQKFRYKIEKASENGIVFGVPDDSFKILGLKFPVGLLLVHPNGPQRLTDIIRTRVLPELKDGVVILNTNIPEKIMKDAGLTDNQFTASLTKEKQKKSPKKRNGKGL